MRLLRSQKSIPMACSSNGRDQTRASNHCFSWDIKTSFPWTSIHSTNGLIIHIPDTLMASFFGVEAHQTIRMDWLLFFRLSKHWLRTDSNLFEALSSRLVSTRKPVAFMVLNTLPTFYWRSMGRTPSLCLSMRVVSKFRILLCEFTLKGFKGAYGLQYNGTFAMIGTAEKGYIDVRVEVESPGGHSSVPPPHTVCCIHWFCPPSSSN